MMQTYRGWWRSSRCDTNACLEATVTASGDVALRDSAEPDGPWLDVDRQQWRRFLRGVTRGDFAGR
ncbi:MULTISPECIES: DUF397 domain-containing protein [unclassified Micromonospora]|uniref:DUF397 domain-containing protein n=2 Tax=Micromonospora TaxID=1873 RepID=UPI003A86632E